MIAVYRGFDQDALDREYMPSRQVPDLQTYIDRYAQESARARDQLAWRSLAYGEAPSQTFDFFPAREPNAPIHVFIHGGYWRILSKRESSFAAPAFVAAGAAFAAVDYTLVPGATLDEIVQEVRSAVAYLVRESGDLGIDASRIHVSGSSAGGHLTGMVAATDWAGQFGLAAQPVRGAIPISALTDLQPVRLSCVNAWMNLDEAAARRNSPIANLPPEGLLLVAAVGADESDEFKRQTLEYGAACRAAGLRCTDLVIAERHHFDVVLDLAEPSSALGRLALAQMNLA